MRRCVVTDEAERRSLTGPAGMTRMKRDVVVVTVNESETVRAR